MPPRQSTTRNPILYLALLASGFAGLGYEIAWTRSFALGLGHEVPSLLAVVAAFFGGVSVGAFVFDGRISRSSYPGRWYAVCELIIGAWGLLSAVLIPWTNQRVMDWIGTAPSPLWHWSIAFGVPTLVLLPSTMAMGATLPAVDRLLGRWRAEGRVVGGVYAANTFGAVAGTLATTFVLIPSLGYRGSLLTLALLNFACVGTLVFPEFRGAWRPGAADVSPTVGLSQRRLLLALFFTGMLGIGFQVLSVRVMSQVMENTVYSFASALSVYLLCTAIGALVYQKVMRGWEPRRTLFWQLILLATTCLLGTTALAKSHDIYQGVHRQLGFGTWAAVVAEMCVALAVFAPPTVIMGTTFSHLAQSARHAGGGVGRALGVNTIGGALAPLIFVVCLLPVVGAKWSLVLVSLGYLALLPESKPWRWVPALAPVSLVLFLPPHLILVQPAPGGRILAHREGVMAAVSVVTDKDEHRYLKVNDRFHMGATVNPANERRLAHIPMLLHPSPRRVLFLGLGTGSTLAAAGDHPEATATAVELVPEIVELQPMFAQVTGDLSNSRSLTIATADARRFVKSTRDRYDLIVADLFQPARDGSGALYTLEHFTAVRGILTADQGAFCQWLPLYQMNRETMLTIVRTFLQVFPHARAYLSHLDVQRPVLGLIGRTADFKYPDNWFDARVGDPGLRRAVMQVGLTDGVTLLGFQLASADQLHALTGAGPLNTDDFPVVAFEAPRHVYAGPSQPHKTLIWLLDRIAARPEEQLAEATPIGTGSFVARLRDYVAARNVFFRAAAAGVEGNRNQAIDGYIESARISPDFVVGYALAINAARQMMAAGDRVGAQDLLDRLVDSVPRHPEARALRESLRRLNN